MPVTGKLKISIDRKGCIRCAKCWVSCPEFFEQKDAASHIIEKYRHEESEIPRNIENLVRRAANLCPARVIRIS